jgi:hypothetical protein
MPITAGTARNDGVSPVAEHDDSGMVGSGCLSERLGVRVGESSHVLAVPFDHVDHGDYAGRALSASPVSPYGA